MLNNVSVRLICRCGEHRSTKITFNMQLWYKVNVLFHQRLAIKLVKFSWLDDSYLVRYAALKNIVGDIITLI